MKVYFVRHGKSIFNSDDNSTATHQFPNTPLSEIGKKQALAIAHRFRNISIDIIISSPYTRAFDTAKAISEVTSTPLIGSDLFIERKFPSIFAGRKVDDPEISHIHKLIHNRGGEPDWHHSDEENFADILTRADKALAFLQGQDKESIAVTTHGYFLSLLICRILFEEHLSYQGFRTFTKHCHPSNTGLTVCEYKEDKWRLLTLNDYAHLGE